MEFTIGKDGITIKSSYLGVILLVISMAFYGLYLKFVYPITIGGPADISSSETHDAAETSAAKHEK